MISGHQEFFFLAIWWAGNFFPCFSHKLSITFVLHAFFSSDKPLQEFFFSNHPPPPPTLQELNGRPLNAPVWLPTVIFPYLVLSKPRDIVH